MAGANPMWTTIWSHHNATSTWSIARFGPGRTDRPLPLVAGQSEYPNIRAYKQSLALFFALRIDTGSIPDRGVNPCRIATGFRGVFLASCEREGGEG